MKSFLFSMVFCVALFATNAKEAAQALAVENQFSTALKKAKTAKKMLILVVVKENCGWCDKLVYKTLSDPEVKSVLKNYITVIADNHDDLPSDFNESFFPSIFYIDYSNGKSLYENVGYVGKKCFLNDLKESQNMMDAFSEE